MSQARVVTYNILSSELSEPETFPENTPEECDGERRFARILSILDAEVQKGSVICLQEVSISWVGKLHCFFQRHGYHFIHTLYGARYSGYMGVCCAVPIGQFSLTSCTIARISDTKTWPAPPKPDSKDNAVAKPGALVSAARYVRGYVANVLDPIFLVFRLAAGLFSQAEEEQKKSRRQRGDPIQDTYDTSKRRWNQAIFVRLAPTSQPDTAICIASYHNPCAIHLRPVITMHAAMVAEWAQKLAGDDPLVLCGDFNCTPDSGAYELLTTGDLDRGHPEYPLLPAFDPWKPSVAGMASAYASIFGKEPLFTNKAVRELWGRRQDPFSGCLDYVFYTPASLVAVSADRVPSEDLSADHVERISYPTSEIPSDHLPVAATFEWVS